MKAFAALALFASLIAQIYALTINTPSNLVQCQPALISWSDGTSPYFITVYPGGQTTGALQSFDSTTDTQLTWTVDIASGTSVTLGCRDSTGEEVYTSPVTISSSSDDSCLNASASSGSESSTTAGTTETGATTSAAATTTGTGSSTSSGTRTSSSSTRASSSTASGSAASSSESSSAMRGSSMNAAGLAGLLGLVGAAIL